MIPAVQLDYRIAVKRSPTGATTYHDAVQGVPSAIDVDDNGVAIDAQAYGSEHGAYAILPLGFRASDRYIRGEVDTLPWLVFDVSQEYGWADCGDDANATFVADLDGSPNLYIDKQLCTNY